MFLFLTKKVHWFSKHKGIDQHANWKCCTFFFYYISILFLFLVAKDEYIFLKWGNIHTWSSDLIQYALGFMPDRGDIPCVSVFCFRHVIFIQHALDGHCLAACEIPAKSYFIVHNFTQMPQIFTVLSLLHTHTSLLGKFYNENIRSLAYSLFILKNSATGNRIGWNVRGTLGTPLSSHLLKPNTK